VCKNSRRLGGNTAEEAKDPTIAVIGGRDREAFPEFYGVIEREVWLQRRQPAIYGGRGEGPDAIPAPVAFGWSESPGGACNVAIATTLFLQLVALGVSGSHIAPTGKRRLVTAHPISVVLGAGSDVSDG
jgi:hypothetical protein